jgi:LruC domain-containing protein
MKNKYLLFFSIALLVFTSMGCKKTTSTIVDEKTIEDMNVPNGFAFETTHEVSVTIKMPESVDFTNLRSRFDIFTENLINGGKLISSGSFDINGEFTGLIRVPTAQKEVFVSCIAGNVTVSVENNSFKQDGVIIDFGDEYGFNAPDTLESVALKSVAATNFAYETGNLSSTNNIIGNGDFEINDFGSIYYWSSTHPVDSKWYFTQYRGSVSRFNDGGNNVIRTPLNNHGFYYGGASQLIDASAGDVITLSADIKSIGNKNKLIAYLFIIPQRANGQVLAYYNLQYNSPSSNWTNKQIVATLPSGTAKVNILLWTHDRQSSASIYFDNIVVTGPVTDADNDGVDDDLDDYPNDASRAFDVYYPNETDWGTLVYEDLWPGTGDYDFNDLVLDYQFQSVLSSENKLVEFFTDYSVRAVGASLHNAFGFSLGGDPANVASVTGNNIVHGDLNMNTNGTEQGQDNTVLFMFDDAFDMIGSSGSTFINTQTDVAYVEPDTSRVHVLYQNPISASVTGTAPYNPFVVVDLPASRGTEVHLPGNAPTDLADMTLFGQWSDDSNPATGKYYQSVTNLPWALDLPVSFEYPVEQVEIINAYNHFVEWAESAGSVYPDWYNDGSGYRNTENIYSPSK